MLDQLWELLFPTPCICPLCLSKQEQLMICHECRLLIDRKKEQHGQCKRCGAFGVSSNGCDNCRDWPNYLSYSYGCWPYQGEFREVILRFKYKREPWLAKILAKEMVAQMEKEDNSVVVAVPLYKKRERKRGYNQSELLAKEIAKQGGFVYVHKGLTRLRETKPQAGLSRSARLTNLDKAFGVRDSRKIAGKRVVLVDDILTSGATLRQCAKVLKRHGAKEIVGITLTVGQR